VRNCHELGECQPYEEGVVRCLEVGYLELQVFSAKVFPSLESYGKSDLTNGGCCYSRYYAMEQCPTGA
jgi:hypothetical protein